MVHGNLASSKHFDTLMESLPKEYTVYAIDMRGSEFRLIINL
ncbi:alpha/beta fold hydrolase [Clostridium sp. Cult1]